MWSLALWLFTAAVTAGVLWRLVYLHRTVNDLRSELARYVASGVLDAPDGRQLIEAPRPTLITVEILNPFELAARQNRLASSAAVVAPSLIKKEVIRQAVLRIKEELTRQGVIGEVRVVRGSA